MQKTIATTIDREIDPTIKEIRDKLPETYDNLDRSREECISNLNNSASSAIERFKTDFRIEMYERIEKDIEDEKCKEIFENEREQGMEELGRTIEGLVKKCEEQFSKDIKKEIEQFEERIKDFLVMLNHINLDSVSDLIFNIASGINKLGLFSSIGGLILLLTAPVLGEIALDAGIVLGAIGVVKSVWSWFSSDYKKSQQKKEVDKNLDKVCGIIEERVRNQLKSYKKIICEKVESLKARLNDPVVGYEHMRE
ncbi:hypothetical protein JP0575_05830 [Helicobacter pylori]